MNISTSITMEQYKILLKEMKSSDVNGVKNKILKSTFILILEILFYIPLFLLISIVIKIGILNIRGPEVVPNLFWGIILILGFFVDNLLLNIAYSKKIMKTSLIATGYIGNHEFIFSEQGIKDCTSNLSIYIPWNYINTFRESKSFILIQTLEGKIMAIPKKDIKNIAKTLNYIKSFVKTDNRFYVNRLYIEDIMNERLFLL